MTVFAAASLTDALEDIAADYEGTSGRTVRLSFAASGAVARQVQAGAPADVVILADEVWMDQLQAAEAIAPSTRHDLLRNTLVVIAKAEAAPMRDPFAALATSGDKIVIGDPDSVPAGAYARSWFKATDRWDALQPHLVTAADVRAVRTFVQRGEAALGVVYRSDTVGATGVAIVAEPEPAQQPVIVYPAAATPAGVGRGRAFLAYLKGPEARRIFAAHGFTPLP